MYDTEKLIKTATAMQATNALKLPEIKLHCSDYITKIL
jgi:hypothetical protein